MCSSSREAGARAARGQNTSQLNPTHIAGSRADEHNSPRSGDGIRVNHGSCLSGFCLLWMEECGCWHPCVPGSYPHAGCRSAGRSLVPCSAWCAQEIQFWLDLLDCGNVCLDYSCGHGSSWRGIQASGDGPDNSRPMRSRRRM